MIFCDSSALVADLFNETRAVALDEPLAASRLCRVEVASALARRARAGELSADEALVLRRRFTVDYAGQATGRPSRFAVLVGLDEQQFDAAHELLDRHPLRSLDALQLAAALTVRDLADAALRFAVLDRRLAAVARAEGLAVLDA